MQESLQQKKAYSADRHEELKAMFESRKIVLNTKKERLARSRERSEERKRDMRRSKAQ